MGVGIREIGAIVVDSGAGGGGFSGEIGEWNVGGSLEGELLEVLCCYIGRP